MRKFDLAVELNNDGTVDIHVMNVGATDVPLIFMEAVGMAIVESARELIMSERAKRN